MRIRSEYQEMAWMVTMVVNMLWLINLIISCFIFIQEIYIINFWALTDRAMACICISLIGKWEGSRYLEGYFIELWPIFHDNGSHITYSLHIIGIIIIFLFSLSISSPILHYPKSIFIFANVSMFQIFRIL